jgi:hypothetical protein
MKTIFRAFLLAAVAATGTSCATIFTKSSYPITFDSNPPGANVTVVNRAGNTVYTGSTPSTVTLKAAAGYMKREEYSVTFQKPGYAPQTVPVICSLDGWYIGNILLGGLIGMLIVDPASGAMYKFAQTDIHATLGPDGASASDMRLRIIDIGQVPEDAELVRIN